MKIRAISIGLFLALIVSGCATLQNGSDFQAGRSALLTGKTEIALSYFQTVADKDPNYYYGTAYQQGVLGFLGRTQYTLGQLPQAQNTLERALTLDKTDDSARLYLGLTLVRREDRQRGVSEIADSMKSIHEFLEWVTQTHRFSFGQFWDPTRKIRSSIENDLAMIRSNEIDWPRLIADGEWLGKEIDEEGDRARYDEMRERQRQSDGGSGSQR
jgi:tetratricopeptide (TPR) repeat protein